MRSRYLLWTALFVVLAAAGRAPSAQRASARLLVLNKEDATLAIVDPVSGNVLGRVPTGQQPHELVASTDGTIAFASNYGTGPAPGRTISMIDIASQKELRRIDVSPLSRPHGLAFANGKLYFTAEADKKIARYDPATDTIDWQFETGQATTHMVLPTKDARTIFTSNIGGDSVSAIQQGADGAWTQTVIPVGKGPEGIDLSPNGREVWSAHSRDGGVSIIDVASKKVVQTINIGTKRSNRIKLTPDGKFALVSDLDAGELVVLDAPARKEIKRIPLGKMPEGILMPPTGGVAYVAVNGDNFIAVIDLKTWQVTKKISTGTGPDGMAWVDRERDDRRAARHSGLRLPEDVRLDRRRRRGVVRRPRRRDLRPDRAKRRRQDDDDGVRRGSANAGSRNDLGPRPGPGPRRLHAAGADRRAAPAGAAAEADQGVGGGRSLGVAVPEEDDRRRPAARPARPGRQAQRLVHDALRRPEAAAVHRPRAHQRSRRRLSRRADDRAGSAVAADDLGAGARHPRARQDGVPDHAPDGGGRAAVRSRRDHRSRPHRRHRHARSGSSPGTAPSGRSSSPPATWARTSAFSRSHAWTPCRAATAPSRSAAAATTS